MSCGHCGYTGQLEWKGNVTAQSRTQQDPVHGDIEIQTIWSLSRCPECHNPTLETYVYVPEFFDPDDVDPTILYPTGRDHTALPDLVRREVDMARRLRAMDPGMFALCVRRILEAVCIDQGANGDTLFKQLQDLVDQDRLPQVLADASTVLRQFGNLGAHVSQSAGVEPGDVPLLDDLAEATLEYLYRAPAKIKAVQARYEKRMRGDGAPPPS